MWRSDSTASSCARSTSWGAQAPITNRAAAVSERAGLSVEAQRRRTTERHRSGPRALGAEGWEPTGDRGRNPETFGTRTRDGPRRSGDVRGARGARHERRPGAGAGGRGRVVRGADRRGASRPERVRAHLSRAGRRRPRLVAFIAARRVPALVSVSSGAGADDHRPAGRGRLRAGARERAADVVPAAATARAGRPRGSSRCARRPSATGPIAIIADAHSMEPEVAGRALAALPDPAGRVMAWLAYEGDEAISVVWATPGPRIGIWEMMTPRRHRRKGGARAVLTCALDALWSAGDRGRLPVVDARRPAVLRGGRVRRRRRGDELDARRGGGVPGLDRPAGGVSCPASRCPRARFRSVRGGSFGPRSGGGGATVAQPRTRDADADEDDRDRRADRGVRPVEARARRACVDADVAAGECSGPAGTSSGFACATGAISASTAAAMTSVRMVRLRVAMLALRSRWVNLMLRAYGAPPAASASADAHYV